MKSVLLIEDDSIFRFLNRKVLNGMGFTNDQIHIALNGKEAIDFLKEGYGQNQTMPDVILLDLKMPIMTGFEFIRAVKNFIGMDKVKIIILTSSINPDDMNRAFDLGVPDYLTKPLKESELAEVLHLNRDKQMLEYKKLLEAEWSNRQSG